MPTNSLNRVSHSGVKDLDLSDHGMAYVLHGKTNETMKHYIISNFEETLKNSFSIPLENILA